MSEIRRGVRQRLATKQFGGPRDEIVDAILGTLTSNDAIHFYDVDFKYFAMKVSTARARAKRTGLHAKIVQSFDHGARHGVAWAEELDQRGTDAA
jgi:hypothetical protein